MNKDIYDLLQSIKFNNNQNEIFKGVKFALPPVFDKKDNTLTMFINLIDCLECSFYNELRTYFKDYYNCNVKLKIAYSNQNITINILNDYIKNIINNNIEFKIFDTLYKVENNNIIYTFDKVNLNKASKLSLKYKEKLEEYGIHYNIQCIEFKKEVMVVETVKAVSKIRNNEPLATTNNKNSQKKLKVDNYPFIAIDMLSDQMNDIHVIGKIFKKESRNLANGSLLVEVIIAADSSAVFVKKFFRDLEDESIPIMNIGNYVKVYGDYAYDTYKNEYVFNAKRVDQIEETIEIDTSDEKRVELHLHTKLSEMDGINDIKEYIQRADKWGWDAIALTDHNVVQAFPKAQHAVAAINKNREKPFKMIYGIEMSMTSNKYNICSNANDTLLKDVTYVMFDLETTGLSPIYDHIIEFGAIKVKNGVILEKKQFFVKPPVSISAFISDLTNISQSDVANELAIKDRLQEIIDFVEDCTLVAHNAQFDIGFLNENLINNGYEPLTNPLIDTLHLAYCLYPNRKSYRLGGLAKLANVPYGDDAHRADYDADVLMKVYEFMIHDLSDDIKTLNDLANLDNGEAYKKLRASHICLLAKNAQGLKEIFKLVTLSHCTYLNYNSASSSSIGTPRITKEEIDNIKLNNNILLGSACFNGEVFEIASTGNEEKLREVIKFYDYIEIQPLNNYKYLIAKNSIKNNDTLIEILNKIIKIAKEENKLVVATGDVHYLSKQDKIFRDVYINTMGIGGSIHPLRIRNKNNINNDYENPNQHLRTTNEMLNEFKFLNEKDAYEYVVTNSNKIVDMIEPIYPVKDRLYPPDIEGSDNLLRELCYKKAKEVYGEQLPKIVEDRLEKELNSIIGHGFYVVYYISHLLVKKSLDDGYMVGSRGSVGSSFVATMASITEVNPLIPHYICPKCHYSKFFEDGSIASGFDLPTINCPNCGELIKGDGQDIPFETFLGFEGDKVPDIDLNFSGDYQPVAHNYTKEVFGDTHAFRAGTIGTVAEKTAFGYAKGYLENSDLIIPKAKLNYLASGCEGVKRTTGQHPGGIIVIPQDMDVHDFTPVQFPANNPDSEWKTTHFEFHDIHDNVLKLDILGHVDPTAMKLLERLSGIDPKSIPMNDIETMSIFNSVENLHIDTNKNSELTGAAGLPEFGTPFVRGILETTKPTTFDELVKISGLSHGTDVWLGNAKDLIDDNVCTLKSVIGCRDDIMVYLIHKGLEPKLAFTIMESVRKGKGLKEEWITTMKNTNVEDWYIDSCQKIKYMFPKAHAVAYVMMAIRVAWFKVHKPIYYYCMFFSIRCDAYDIKAMLEGEISILNRMNQISAKIANQDKVTNKETDTYNSLELALEMHYRGYSFSNIDLMKSEASTFIVDPQDNKKIIPPFTSIDGLGENVAKSVVAARNQGVFLSKEDLQKRTSLNGTHIKFLESIKVLDSLQDENQMSLF